MAKSDKVANSYAKAIYEFLKTEAKVRAMIQELTTFTQLNEANAELSHVLTTEVFTETQRAGVVDDISEKLKLSADTKRILHVLSTMRRLGHTGEIAEKLNLLLLDVAGVVPVRVEASTALDSGEKEKVEQRFTKLLGKKVEASYVVDPSLIGGLRVTAAGKTYDGSVAGWLEAVQEKLNAELVGGNI